MENASKALLMAGGVLIAVLIIAILVRTFGTVGLFQKQKLTEEESRQIAEFNEQYLKYLNQYMYGTEVITIINKTTKSKYPVRIKITFLEEYTYTKKEYIKGKLETRTITMKSGKTLNILNNENEYILGDSFIEKGSENYGSTIKNDVNNTATSSGISNKAFKCTAIGYDNSTGRINSITINEKKWKDV